MDSRIEHPYGGDMEPTTPNDDGAAPGGDGARREAASPPADALTSVAALYAGIDASRSARTLLAQVLSAALTAFTSTRSVRDPLPDTASGSPEEALAVVAGIDQLRASLTAVDATWQVAAEKRIREADRREGLAEEAQGRGASHELALARRISPAASSLSLASARRLNQYMPRMFDHLWDGTVAEQQASIVAAALEGASPETCARIDEILHEHPGTLEGKSRKRLREDVDEMIQRLEPETSRERAERAARGRHVTMTPLADGMARISAVLRAIDAAGMMQALTSQAQSLKAAGERTSASALEADLLVDAVIHPQPSPAPSSQEVAAPASASQERTASEPAPREHTPPAPRRPRTTPGLDVGIVITDTALLGRDDDAECAQLEGYGVIPAHIVSDTLLGRPPGQLRPVDEPHPDEEVSAVFRRLYRGPRTGELIAMESQARAFPAGLARMIRWRDTTCRTPWCNARIRQSDHVVPHHEGGPTNYANGQGLCVRCNLLKEHGLWVLTPIGPDGVAAPAPASSPIPASSAELTRSQSPPYAWIWSSPHGAQGVSLTPPLRAPRAPTTDDEGAAAGADPPTPLEFPPAAPAG